MSESITDEFCETGDLDCIGEVNELKKIAEKCEKTFDEWLEVNDERDQRNADTVTKNKTEIEYIYNGDNIKKSLPSFEGTYYTEYAHYKPRTEAARIALVDRLDDVIGNYENQGDTPGRKYYDESNKRIHTLSKCAFNWDQTCGGGRVTDGDHVNVKSGWKWGLYGNYSEGCDNVDVFKVHCARSESRNKEINDTLKNIKSNHTIHIDPYLFNDKLDPRPLNYTCVICNQVAFKNNEFRAAVDISGLTQQCNINIEQKFLNSYKNTSVDADCELSGWSGWSDCDKATGEKKRTRSVSTPKTGNGAACSNNKEEISDCPVDCEVSNWGNYGACTDGKKTRKRTVTTESMNGGTACGPLEETIDCDDDDDSKKLSTGAIIGIVMGGLFLLLILWYIFSDEDEGDYPFYQ